MHGAEKQQAPQDSLRAVPADQVCHPPPTHHGHCERWGHGCGWGNVGGAMRVGPCGCVWSLRCWLMCMTPYSCRVWGEDAPAGRRVLPSTHGLL